MKIYTELPATQNTVLTIGSFDGIHLGHQYLIQETKSLAKKYKAIPFIISFQPHPRLVLRKNDDFRLLTSLEEKLKKFESIGVENLVLLPFDDELSKKNAEEFVHQYILTPFKPRAILLGYDHKFGKDRQGSEDTFRAIREKLNLTFDIIQLAELKNTESKISSTTIRNFLYEGNLLQANNLLGGPYQLHGTIIRGQKLGRTIGYPTANLKLQEPLKLIPKFGVYASTIEIDGIKFYSATSIGSNPTVSDSFQTHIETFIFDFDQDIYGEEVVLELMSFIREEAKFDSLDVLKDAIADDISKIKAFFF